ncbi:MULTISPECIES: alpha/beta fold hydrolase [unclassified Streptomyces]|uniref:alpha/beta fold hydrolase n=1 Tax=unclassified Streptomyces TaxID=2593676 RepID=UPI001F54673C|nr:MULTISPECIES: alpha/beta fold hydrolase [unclassified Streptomyces]
MQTATGAARLSSRPQTQDALLWYVALQASLSYAASGWVKLIGEKWRSGAALPGVMRTRTYGFEGAFRLTQKYPRSAKAVQHGVLALECLFPLVYVGGGRLTRPFLAGAAGFHTANAFVMGLGRFLTAFTSMHPMVAYTSAPASHPAVVGRDDRAVKAAGLVLAAGVAVGAALAAQRRSAVLEGWPTSRSITTRHGNELQYETGGREDTDAPVLVFCAGLSSTSEHFAWITEKFVHGSEYAVVAYARAGYAGSHRRRTAPYSLRESVDDLEDLVRQVIPAHRKAVLVGHSLGGELVRQVAARLPDRIAGLVYLDPAHPAELRRSQRQNAGAADLGSTITHATRYLRCGTGMLMSRPKWVDSLPPRYREKVFAQYTDARLWKAARREWRAVEEEFRSFDGDLDPISVPGLVIAAQHTVDQEPEQLLMYDELVKVHRDVDDTGVRVVEGADHDSLLTDARFAHQAAEMMAEFLAGPVARTEGPAPAPQKGTVS